MMETTSSFESPSVGCLTKVFALWMKPTTSSSSTFLLLRWSDYTVSSSTTDSDASAIYVKFSTIVINIFYIVLDALILLRNITKHVCMAHGMKCSPQQCPRLLYDFHVYIDYILSLKSYVSYLVDNLFYRMMLVSFSYSILEEGVHDYQIILVYTHLILHF